MFILIVKMSKYLTNQTRLQNSSIFKIIKLAILHTVINLNVNSSRSF